MPKSKVLCPYRIVRVSKGVKVKPEELKPGLSDNFLTITKQAFEGRNIKCGNVVHIFDIKNHEENFIDQRSSSKCVEYQIDFIATICNVFQGSVIYGIVDVINPSLIIVRNGPLMVLVNLSKDYSRKNFEKGVDVLLSKREGVRVDVGSSVIVRVKAKINSYMDNKIFCLGYLENVATVEQIEKFWDEINQFYVHSK